MIKIGSKVKLNFIPGHNDMSHYTASHFSVSGGYWYVTDEMYLKLIRFTEKIEVPKKGSLDELMGTTFADRIKAAMYLNPNKSMLWEYNGLSRDMVSYERHVALFGERDFVIPKWSDIYLKLPVLNLVCRVLNAAIYFKVKKEYEEWDRFLKSIRKNA